MALSEEERRDLERRFREELEAEHRQRLEDLEDRKMNAVRRSQKRQNRKRQKEVLELRAEVENEFRKEKGYVLHEDSRGHQRWLTPQEAEWKKRRKSRRVRRPHKKTRITPKRWEYLLYAGIGIVAVLLGLLMVE